jgi:hypothetical protein
MTPSQEPHDFEQLRTLLRLKRHELPPPGYFVGFSSKVIARIEADASFEPDGWWERFLARFESNPVLACAYSVAIGGLLVVAMGLSQVLGREQAANLPGAGTWLATIPVPAAGGVASTTVEADGHSFPTPMSAAPAATASSMDPLWSSGAPSFLINGGGVRAEQAGFRLPSR